MTVACPACDAACSTQPLRRFTATEASQHFVLAQEFPQQHAALTTHIEQLWGSAVCDLLSCAACGLEFAWPFVAGDARFYNLAYPYSDYPSQRWEFLETVRALEAQPLASGKVLEIGSGFGYFLRQVSPRFVAPDQVVAIEYNDVARKELEALGFAAHGIDVRSDAFSAYRGQVAAVFMFQVLEHLDRMDELLERLRELLMPGGQIFIAVPNIHRINHNERHGALLDMPPNHISRWTEKAFRAMAERLHCDLLVHRVEPMHWNEFVKRDLVYSHMRRAQQTGSLANRVRGRPRTALRVAAEAGVAALSAPSRLPGWVDAARQGQPLGDSVWVHLRVRGTPGSAA